MCGIAGTYRFGDSSVLQAMTDSISHRGPDGEYFFRDDEVQLGNRRLAIQDLEGGAQPMTNEDGSIVVVYNGEIYNYSELRDELEAAGHRLQTRCDTELLPHLFEEHGIGMLERLNGIYAFALVDKRSRTLWLARDPLGVKPLVYARRGDQLVFASESKAIVASGFVAPEIDEASLHLTMNVRYIPGNRTLFAGIRRVPPGAAISMTGDRFEIQQVTNIDWTEDRSRSEQEWADGIVDELDAAVERQLLSDVEVGVSLSGGIDSSTIVAMIRRRHKGPLRSFTLGFDEPTDENEDARFVASHFGTLHEEIILHEPSMSYLEEAIRFVEEPKVNCLQLYLLHRFVGSHVKVVLSGLGGDELFAGYDIYRYIQRLAPVREHVPRALLSGVGPGLGYVAQLSSRLRRPSLDLYIRGLEWLGSIADGAQHYLLLRNAWDFNEALLERIYTPQFAARLHHRVREEYDRYFEGDRPLESLTLQCEFRTKMVDDLLHNEDTMSMAHSVESRVPFLDIDFVRFAARIPDRVRFGRGMKGLLKHALRDVLPSETLNKKKWGFTVDPVEQYKKDLRPLALTWLTRERLGASGVFNYQFVEDVLAAKPRPQLRWHYFMLWQMIGLEMWRSTFVS